MTCMCLLFSGVLEITIILERDSDIQIFLNGDVLLNGSWVDLDGTLKWRVEGQLLLKERNISELEMWANCVLKHRLSLKTFIPNFVAFFVSLAIVISYIRKMSFSVTSAKREFTPAGHCFIIHLPWGGQWAIIHRSGGEYSGLFTDTEVDNYISMYRILKSV